MIHGGSFHGELAQGPFYQEITYLGSRQGRSGQWQVRKVNQVVGDVGSLVVDQTLLARGAAERTAGEKD